MRTESAFEILERLLGRYTIKEISEGIGVNVGTAKRWLENGEVPKQYVIEFKRFSGEEIDYEGMSEVEKDQFFTSPQTAEYCFRVMKEKLRELGEDESKYGWIEPSVGDGSFGRLMKKGSIFIDVDPKYEGTIKQDFLGWEPADGEWIVMGNPPFGFRGNLALKFMNHASKFANFVAFIVPQTFESNGKGSCKLRVRGLNLIHSERIGEEFHYPDGRVTNVSCVFQIWSKSHKVKEEKVDVSHLVKIMSVSDGGTPGTTRNKKYHDKCSYFVVSSHYGKEKLILETEFKKLSRGGYGFYILDERVCEYIEKINFQEICFVSTNGAVNLRLDIIEKALYNELPDELRQSQRGVLPL